MAKKKWPKADKYLHVPLYGGSVYFYKDREKHDAACVYLGGNPTSVESAGQASQWVNTEDGKTIYLIGCFDESSATRAHETAHIALFICRHVGIDPLQSEEPFCYLIGWLYEALHG